MRSCYVLPFCLLAKYISHQRCVLVLVDWPKHVKLRSGGCLERSEERKLTEYRHKYDRNWSLIQNVKLLVFGKGCVYAFVDCDFDWNPILMLNLGSLLSVALVEAASCLQIFGTALYISGQCRLK